MNYVYMRLKTALACSVVLVGMGLISGSAVAQDLAAGRDLAENLCEACHAIGATGESANAEAPTFRDIAARYSVWNLQEALAEGIVVGHEDMPAFTFSPEQIDALLSYMDTLTPPDSQ